MIHVGICDDDREFLHRLRHILLGEFPRQFRLYQFTRGTELLHSLQQRELVLDVIVLDIQMPDLNGIEVARSIREFDRDVVILFMTQWDDYVWQGYDVQAYHYLRKSIQKKAFLQVFSSAVNVAKRNRVEESLLVHNRALLVRVPLDDIIMIECKGGKLVVHTKNGREYQYYEFLSKLAPMLQGHGFFQTHKSYLVNLRHTIYVDRELAVAHMEEGHKALVTKSKVSPLLLEMQKGYIGSIHANR